MSRINGHVIAPGHRPRESVGRFIVLRCDSGDPNKGPWEPVPIDDVPNWLRDPDVVGRLADEQTVARNEDLDSDIPVARRPWYRVERVRVIT